MKLTLGVFLAFGIGVVARVCGIPLPAPTSFFGVLLIFCMTFGFYAADRFLLK